MPPVYVNDYIGSAKCDGDVTMACEGLPGSLYSSVTQGACWSQVRCVGKGRWEAAPDRRQSMCAPESLTTFFQYASSLGNDALKLSGLD